MKIISKTGIVQDAFGFSLIYSVVSVALCIALGLDVFETLGIITSQRISFAFLVYAGISALIAACLKFQNRFATGEAIKETSETAQKIQEQFVKFCAALSAVALTISICEVFREIDRWNAVRPLHWEAPFAPFIVFVVLLAIANAFHESESA